MAGAKRLLSVLIGSLALAVTTGGQSLVQATVVEPCLTEAAQPGPDSITFVPIKGGNQTYCQSAFGWSDGWFPTSQPATYDGHQDVLSGDNAPGLLYATVTGERVGSGNPQNFIGPWLDGGTLDSMFIGSNWTVVEDIAVTGNVGTSKITLGGLDASIRTTVGADGVMETFTFTNHTNADIAVLLFADYFNFHANGSLTDDVECPATAFDAVTGTVTTTGNAGGGCSPIVANGTMMGSQLPLTWDLGLSTAVLANIEAGTLNDALGPVIGDGAAYLVWDLGALPVDASTEFTIFKNFTPLPEPASSALVAVGLAALGLIRRRRHRRLPPKDSGA